MSASEVIARDLQPENSFLGNTLDTVPAAAAGRFEITAIEPRERVIEVTWRDGHHSEFHFIWLRHNCSVPSAAPVRTGLRFKPRDRYPSRRHRCCRTRPRQRADRHPGTPTGIGRATTRYGYRSYCYSTEERDRRYDFRPHLWRNELASDLPTFPAPRPDCSDADLLDVYDLLLRYGIVRLTGVGTDPADTEMIASLLGPIRQTTENGYIYDVQSDPVSKFGAATPMKQHPHTDDPYQYAPPGMDVFHCIANPGMGGESVYVDGFAIAESLRTEEPEAFRLLSTVPVPFVRCHPGRVDFRTDALVIGLDERDRVTDIRFFDRGVAPLDLPGELVEPMFAAQRAFIERMTSPEFQIELLLTPGDAILLDNSRVMHGRNAFPADSDRRLRLAYIDREEFHARWRDLARRLRRLDHDIKLLH